MNNYRVESLLGEGAFATVNLVSDLRDGSFHALKTLKKVSRSIQLILFKKEIAALKKIRDVCKPHLLCLEEIFEVNDTFSILTNYVVGYNLEELKGSYIDLDFAENFLFQLLPVLEDLEKEKIAHRDIKKTNIIYNPVTQVFTIIDFGLSIINESSGYAGSPGYLSPTIMVHRANLASSIQDWLRNDVFALGGTLFIVLNESRPYKITAGNPESSSHVDRLSKSDYNKPNPWKWNESKEIKNVVIAMLQDKYTASQIINLFYEG